MAKSDVGAERWNCETGNTIIIIIIIIVVVIVVVIVNRLSEIGLQR